MTDSSHLRPARAILTAMLLGSSSLALAQNAPIVQPGAPGQNSRTLTADEAIKLAGATYSPGDVAFMQSMIVHHQQAVQMAKLIKDRTNREEVVAVGGRIEAAQADEMTFMNEWLETRGEKTVMAGMTNMSGMDHSSHKAGMDHSKHAMVDHSTMAGMASPADLAKLATLQGAEFDRMFLTLMIAHHEGAVEMVDDLLDQPGSAADPMLFRFISDVENDQSAEIKKMDALLASLSPDPRASLTPGFADAGEAIMNLRKVASFRKPAGFFNPDNPADLRPEVPSDEDAKGDDDTAGATVDSAASAADVAAATALADAADPDAPATRDKEEGESLTQYAERSPLLDFANTDMAFFDDIMVAGNYHGFNIYKLGADGAPSLMSSVVCPGGRAMSRSSATSS